MVRNMHELVYEVPTEFCSEDLNRRETTWKMGREWDGIPNTENNLQKMEYCYVAWMYEAHSRDHFSAFCEYGNERLG